jgi:pyruvate-ferredoxin/flavodoxin oxidoreductase
MLASMGKRTNTILQAAFFALANIMPIEEAVEHMKDAATKSYSFIALMKR